MTAVAVMTWGLAVPGLASAAQSFSISSPTGGNSFPANGNVPYTTTMNFDSSAGAPQRALITTSPGVLAALSANPSCVQTRQITEACHIGDGQAFLAGGAPASLSAYLVPANDPKDDVAGVDLITNTPGPTSSTTHAEIQLQQNSSGNVSAVLNVDFSGAGAAGSLITGSTLTVNKTLNGKPFTRMPSNCSPGPSSLTVTYANGSKETTAASPDFHITGCSSLPYAPKFAADITKDATDDGVKVVTTITQNADEAATAANGLTLPWPALGPNFAGLSNQCSTAPCGKAVGTVTAASPLLAAPLTGNAYLTGTPLGPKLTLLFPPPNALELVGTVSLPTHTVVFNGVPDVPQTSLVVTLFGGPTALEVATCSPPGGTATGSFTGQNGAKVTVNQEVKVTGCPPPKPTLASASLSGLPRGKPVLRFKLAQGFGGPKLRAFTLVLPKGLSLNRRARHRGLSIHGARSVAFHGNRLRVRLRDTNAVVVKLAWPLLVAKHRNLNNLKLRFSVTDATGRRTSLVTTV